MLTLADVAEAFGGVADASGPGARRLRESRLGELAERASEAERDLLQRIIYGEMRMGLSEGLVLEAIAEAAHVAPAAVRRAALVTGDVTTVATLALLEGAEALSATQPRVFAPLLPMLAEVADGGGKRWPLMAGFRRQYKSTVRASRFTVTGSVWPSGTAGSPT